MKFSGLELQIYLDLFSSWEMAVAGPIKVDLYYIGLLNPPVFESPPSTDSYQLEMHGTYFEKHYLGFVVS